jgi:hypothetical protein
LQTERGPAIDTAGGGGGRIWTVALAVMKSNMLVVQMSASQIVQRAEVWAVFCVVMVTVAAQVQVQVSPMSTMRFWLVSPPLNTTGAHLLSVGLSTVSAWVPVVLS